MTSLRIRITGSTSTASYGGKTDESKFIAGSRLLDKLKTIEEQIQKDKSKESE